MRLYIFDLLLFLFLFVFVFGKDTQNSNNNSCDSVCLIVIGGLFTILILSIPTAFIIYFLYKIIWDLIRKYLRKEEINNRKTNLNQIEMFQVPHTSKNRNNYDTSAGRNSITMLEIIDELPEN